MLVDWVLHNGQLLIQGREKHAAVYFHLMIEYIEQLGPFVFFVSCSIFFCVYEKTTKSMTKYTRK